MSSIIGLQHDSLTHEIQMIEELEKLVERERRVTQQRVVDRTANQLQSIYLNYLSNLSPFRPQSRKTNRNSNGSNGSDSRIPAPSPAFLLSEPKQLDFNSNERQTIQSFINVDTNEVPENSDTFADIQQISYEKTSIQIERSTSPIKFPQTKSVQTDGQYLLAENYSQVLDKLMDELKLLLKDSNKLIIEKNNETLKPNININNEKEKHFCVNQTQTSEELKPIKETFTQYEPNYQLIDAFCQIEPQMCDKIIQTDMRSDEKPIKIKTINSSTQTDPLTDEEKSYDLSVGEVPYISDDSSYC